MYPEIDMGLSVIDQRISRLSKRELSRAGFTLVELMITVSIVGILASIALPNYQNFITRSRRTEAKLTLSALYIAETTFRVDQNSYTSCLSEAGYVRPATGTLFYSAGFGNTSLTCGNGTDDCHVMNFGTLAVCTAGAFPAGGFFVADKGYSGPAVTRAVFNANLLTNITRSSFRAGVVGQISPRNPAIVDAWSIDEGKNIINDKSGL